MDIETVRLRAEFLALETLVVMLAKAIGESTPAAQQSLAIALKESGEKLTRAHPKGVSAEQGDLLMAELQDAWEALSRRVLPKP
jgi:hypothetical protein